MHGLRCFLCQSGFLIRSNACLSALTFVRVGNIIKDKVFVKRIDMCQSLIVQKTQTFRGSNLMNCAGGHSWHEGQPFIGFHFRDKSSAVSLLAIFSTGVAGFVPVNADMAA